MSKLLPMLGRGLELHPAIPILQKHLEFLVERYEHFTEAEGMPEALGEMFSIEWMHDSMSKVAAHGVGDLMKVCHHAVWTKQRLSQGNA